MKQPIAGVAPPELDEVTVMEVWPSIAAYPSGRFLGRLYSIQWPNWYIFRLGNLLALLSIPHALALYAYRLLPSFCGMPFHGTRYRLTNRRVIEVRNELACKFPFLRFKYGAETKSIALDRFDSVELVRSPGQNWFDAGDLVFRNDNVETFRLDGVSRPEAFRQTCVKSQMSFVGVKQALEREAAHV